MLNSILNWSHTFSHLAPESQSFALLNADSELLYVHPHSALDISTLSLAAQTVKKFFQIQDGDFFILNDPSCGGLGAGDLTFVGKVKNFFVVSRSSFKEEWSFGPKSQFFRIPPTPLVSAHKVQTEIFEALTNSSDERKENIDAKIQWFLRLGPKIQRLTNRNKNLEDKASQKKYFSESFRLVDSKLEELFHTEFQNEIKSKLGETLKIKKKLTDQGLVFDLSGTSAGTQLHLPESWTRGVFAHFLFDLIDESHLINEGSLSNLRIIQSMNSFTNSSSSQNNFLGRHLGTPLVQTALHQGFCKSHKSIPWSTHCYFPMKLQFKTETALVEFQLPSGSGISNQKAFVDGLNTVERSNWFSMLDLKKIGAEVVSLTPRENPSKEKSNLPAGRGWEMKIQFHKASQLKFIKSSDPASNLKIEHGKNVIDLPYGDLAIQAGDILNFVTGSA